MVPRAARGARYPGRAATRCGGIQAVITQAIHAMAFLLEKSMATEHIAILYEHADGRRAVVSANRVATFAIDNQDWHRAGPVEIVWVDETAPAWRPIETAPRDGRTLLLGKFNSHGKWRTMRGKWMSEDYIAEYWEDPDDVEPGWFETAVEPDDPPNCWPINPTHWMHLPPSPSSADEGGSKT